MLRMHRAQSRAAATMLVVLAAAACSDSGITNVAEEPAIRSVPQFAIIPTPAQVIVQGTDLGSFNTYLANFSGRATTEFWDNLSADNDPTLTPPAFRCSIGFFASGNWSDTCKNQTAGTSANKGGYDTYWADGPQNRDPSSFMFNGTYSYNVTLKGAVSTFNSTIGWFTRDITGYHFNPVPAWSAKTINHSIVINTGGANWGLYITNTFNPDFQGCGVVTSQSACSDALGGFSAQEYQQFAMFMNPAQTSYLVGIEDNELEVGGVRDSDYQDYIVAVEPIAYEPPVIANSLGCSPGYWKNHNFPAGYSKNQLFSATSFGGSTFENAFPGMTLQQVLSQGGGGLAALGRQTVSAFFNGIAIATFEKSGKKVIDEFNAAVPGSTNQYNALKDTFENLTDINGRTCPNPTGK